MYALKVLDESNALQIIDILKSDYTALQKNNSVTIQIWEKFQPKYNFEKSLPFIEDCTSTKGDHLIIFAEKGKVPDVPGSYYSETYGKYVVYEQTAKHNNFWECQDKAKELLRQYGYKSEQ